MLELRLRSLGGSAEWAMVCIRSRRFMVALDLLLGYLRILVEDIHGASGQIVDPFGRQ